MCVETGKLTAQLLQQAMKKVLADMEELDSQLLDQSTTGWMEENAGQVQYNGGAEVKIPKMQMSGLGNYDRDGGFAKGAVTVTYETRRLTQDRGRTFQLDAMDVDEMNFAPTAGAVMREFQNTKVIPEIDAYRYSKIAEHGAGGRQGESIHRGGGDDF